MRPLVSVFLCVLMIAGLLVYAPSEAAALPTDATIYGQVTDGTDPIADAYVKVLMMMADGIEVNYAFSDLDGNYAIGVPGGFDYMLFAVHADHYFTMDMVSIAPSESVEVNVTMTPVVEPRDVTLKGYVLDEAAQPVTTGNIIAISHDPLGVSDMPVYGSVAQADLTGYYETTVIASDYGGGAVIMDIPGFNMISNESYDPIVSGGSYWFNLTLESPTYADDCHVSGTVTDDLGVPISVAMVTVRVWNESTMESYTNYTFTDGAGLYDLNYSSGDVEMTFSKYGYTSYMERFPAGSGTDSTLDVTLYALSGEMHGNVTDASTGLGIPDAQVMQMRSEWYSEDSSLAWYTMTFTDPTGYYELQTWPSSGPSSTVAAMADGYASSRIQLDILGTGTIWVDFELAAVNSAIEGFVVDYLTGSPIVDAWVSAESSFYREGSSTDGTGYYSIPVPAGEFTVYVYAMNYRNEEAVVTVPDSSTVTQDFALLPWDLPDSTRLYGWVNTSGTLLPVAGADVQIALEDLSDQNSTMSNETGFYEIMVPSVPLAYHVTAQDHDISYGLVDATGVTELRMDILMDPDLLAPVVTYSQAPTENVTWINPSVIHIEIEEANLNNVILFHYMFYETNGSWDKYYVIDGSSLSFDPWNPGGDLPYTVVGDTYTIDTYWDGIAQAGWLGGPTNQAYLWAYDVLMYGIDPYYAIRAYYANSTVTTPQSGTAFFDQATGAFYMFMFDEMGTYGVAYPDDITGIVSPAITRIDVNTTDPNWWLWIDGSTAGDWSVVDLVFTYDEVAPSGDYKTMFISSDFGNHWSPPSLTNMTVDNQPPEAVAGADQSPVVNTTVTLDGSGSSDNVGIVSYTWEYDNSTGDPIVLDGMTVDVVFDAAGDYTVTLTVVDGGGHSATDTVLISVLPDGVPVADAGPDQEVDEDTLVSFDGSGSSDDLNVTAYDWTIVELSAFMSGVTAEYTFADPGVYHVELVVTDTIGQVSDPDTCIVTVTDTTAPVAVADADATDVSVGSEVTFDGSGSSDNSGTIDSWTWTIELDGDVVTTLSGEIESYTFNVPGVYTVTLEVADEAGLTDTDSLEITVTDDDPPVADAGTDVEVEAGTLVTLDGSDSSDNVGIVNYTWTFMDGTAQVLYGETAEYTFDNVGEFNLTLTVMDAEGLTDTDTVTVRVVSANDPPVADAGDDTVVTVGDAIEFDGSGSTDEDLATLNYTWTFEYDDETYTRYGVSFEFTFDVAGEYDVTLTVTDSEGLTDEDTVTITVEGEATTFLEDYWWALVAGVAAVVVLLAIVLLMKRKGGGPSKADSEEEELVEEEEEEPPAPDEDEL